MPYLGIRFTNKDLTYVVLDGKFDAPCILLTDVIRFPKNFERPKILDWLLKELEGIFSKYEFESVFIKGMEPAASKNGAAALHRIENEAIAFLVAAQHGIELVERVVDATIASRLGVGARYKRRLTYEACSEMFSDLTDDKAKDAVLAAWVKMK
jgi:Holliday junction resolvasome RuvABC endonuclease subunit